MLVLPGLFDFVGGVNSAINQRSNRLSNENQVTSNFVNSLNAFNLAQNTDDNLQLRSLFQQSEGPTVLDRLDDVFSRANNPFVAQQALIASQQAAPLLAQRTQQNPFLNQGLPVSPQAQIQQGLFGINPIMQLQANQQIGDIFAQTPNLNPLALQQGLGMSQNLGQVLAATQQQSMARALAQLQRQNQQLMQNQPTATQLGTLPNQTPTNLDFRSGRIQSTANNAPSSNAQGTGNSSSSLAGTASSRTGN